MSVIYLFCNSRFRDVTQNYSFIAALYIPCVTVHTSSYRLYNNQNGTNTQITG